MRLLIAAAVAAIITVTGSARAAGEHKWYGWQIMAADATTVASSVFLSELPIEREYVSQNFAVGYLLGGPIVHLAHRNYAAAAGSLALRAALPIAGAYAGCALNGPGEDGECDTGTVLGLFVGIVAAGAIDTAAFSYAEVKAKPPKSFEVTPTASFGANAATCGLQGVF